MLHESGINIYYTRSFFAKQISCKGLYKKFELSPVNYRPIGCPGLQRLNGFCPHFDSTASNEKGQLFNK